MFGLGYTQASPVSNANVPPCPDIARLGCSNWTGIMREAAEVVELDVLAADPPATAEVEAMSLGSNRHKISLPFAKLFVKYVF